MKNKCLITVILLLIFLIGKAQHDRSRGYLALSAGPSVAVGEYAEKDFTKSSSGFAKTGQSVKLSYAYLFGKRLGIKAVLQGQRNPIDAKSFEHSLSRTKFYQGVYVGTSPSQPPPQGPYSIYSNWMVEKGSWLLGSLRMGAYGELSTGEGSPLSLTGEALIGAVYVSAPGLTGNSITDTATAQITQSGGTAFGMAFSVAGGVRYNLNNKFCLIGQLEYLGTSEIWFHDVKLSFTSARYSNGNPTSVTQSSVTGEGKQKIGSVNLHIGVGLYL